MKPSVLYGAVALAALAACTPQSGDQANDMAAQNGAMPANNMADANAMTSVGGSAQRHSDAETRQAVETAIADPARADQAEDDARRKAAASLEFSGAGPGDTVVDFFPGQAYWTRMFTNIVGDSGHVYALWPKSGEKYAGDALSALKDRDLANVTAEVQDSDLPSVPQPVDIFWTVQNYHDIANKGGADKLARFDKAVYRALKPGGTYVVIDHAAKPGSGLDATNTLHRIDPQAVKDQVTAAGFDFVGSSDALANPDDDHAEKVFNPEIRGHTDQFMLKFRKPAG